MATQEDRIRQLIGRMQGVDPRLKSAFDAPLISQLPTRQIAIPQQQPGSLLSVLQGEQPQPVQQPTAPSFGQTSKGRTIYTDRYGTPYSEIVNTYQLPDGQWVNYPTVDAGGNRISPDRIESLIEEHKTDDGVRDFVTGELLPYFETKDTAVESAKKRSNELGKELALKRDSKRSDRTEATLPPAQTALDIFQGFESPYLPEPTTSSSDESQNFFMQVGRGLGRGVTQSTLTLGQGLFATADMVTNLVGYEDAIDPETSEFLETLNEIRESVGYEEGMVGKLAEALGSMATLLVPGLGSSALYAKAASAAAQGAAKKELAKRLKNYARGLRALTVPVASGLGAGTANQMLEAYADAGNEVTNAQRNLSTRYGLVIGLTELLPLEILLRGIPKSLGKNTINSIAVRAAQNISVAGAEGAQEAVAGIMQELAAQGNYNPDQPIGDSALSDFGYGAGAGSIIDALLGKKFRLPKTDKALEKEYQSTEALTPLSEEELSAAQQAEQDVAFYDNEGKQQKGQVVRFDENTVELTVDGEIVSLPRSQMPDPNTGFSFAPDDDLLTPRFKVDGDEIGSIPLSDLVDLRNKEALPDALRAKVDAGTMSLNDAIEESKTDDQQPVSRISPDKKYRLLALTKEINRRDPDFNPSLTEKAADQQGKAQTAVEIDSGEFGDTLGDRLNDMVSPTLEDTVLGRTVGGEVSEEIVGEAALKKAMKGVSKKDKATYYEEVGASPDAEFGSLSQDQVVALFEKARGHKGRKKAEKEAQKEREQQAATDAEVERRAQELVAAQQDTVVVPTPEQQAQVAAEEIAETVEDAAVQVAPEPEVVVEEEAPAPSRFESKVVDDSKPRYRSVTPVFESLLDKALYIVGNPRSKSKADDEIMGELRRYLGRGVPGFPDAEIRRLGALVRDRVKQLGEPAEKGTQTDFVVPTINAPDASIDVTGTDVVVEEPTPKPVKPTLSKAEKVVFTDEEKSDYRNVISTLLPGNKKAPKIGREAYERLRGEGQSHEDALDNIENDPAFIDLINTERDHTPDFSRAQDPEQVSPGPLAPVAGTQTAPGVPGMLVQRDGPPIDFNTVRRIKKIVSDVAPTSDLVIASQLYGQVVDRDGDVQYIVNGNEVNYEQALGLQMGNIVGVSVAPDGLIDPENRSYHEATHFLFNNGFLTDAEIKSLIANRPRLEQIVRDHLGQDRYNDAMSGNEFQNFNELIAYGSALYNRGLDVDGKVPKEFNPALRRIFAKIARLFKQLKSNFTGEFVPMEVEQVFEQIRQGRTGRRTADPQATQRVREAMLKEDPAGLSATTPLFVIKQGPVAASSSSPVSGLPIRPDFKSAMKTKLESMAGQKKLPEAWGRVKGRSVQGALSGVKIEEWNDSNIESFLNSLPPDKSVSGQELLDYFNDIEQLVEVQVYGSSLTPESNQDSEIKYRAALQQDRNDQAYVSIANDAMTSLRTGYGIDVVNNMQVSDRIRSVVPNKKNINPAFPPDVTDALRAYADALKGDRLDSASVSPKKQKLIDALQESFKRRDVAFDKIQFGTTLVEASKSGGLPTEPKLKSPGFAFETDAGVVDLLRFSIDTGGYELAPDTPMGSDENFHFKYTSMGGRGLPPPADRAREYDLAQDLGYRVIIISAPMAVGSGVYHSHFEYVRNPIMHIRLADIILENGESVLVIEEMQSDVHQHADSIMKELAVDKLFDEGLIPSKSFERLNREQKNLVRENTSQFKDEVYGKYLPDLPLKDENQRIAFAMQQITRMAVNGGYDHIAVSNSELQVERYRDEYKGAIDGLVMTQVADVPTYPLSVRIPPGQARVLEVFADIDGKTKTFKVTEEQVLEQLEILIDQEIFAPIGPDPVSGSFAKQRELTGGVVAERLRISDQDYIDELQAVEQEAINTVNKIFLQGDKSSIIADKYKPGLMRAADGALQDTVAVTAEDGVRLAFMKALVAANPDIPSSWLATYTTPVVGVNNEGQMVRGNFQRATIELGNEGTTLIGNPSLDDWLGEDVSKLVRNELQNPDALSGQFFATDFVSFIQDKVAKSQTQKERLNAGDTELSPYQRSEAELMDSESIQRSVNNLTGAIDIPVGGGFVNIYDVKLPQALETALASLLPTDASSKKKRKKVREDNQGKRLYLGSGHSLAKRVEKTPGDISGISEELSGEILIEESQIIPTDQVQSMPQRARYLGSAADGATVEGISLQQAIGESFYYQDDAELADVSKRFMVPVSNSRNALRVYELTPEIKESPKVLEPSDIYFARLQNERAEVTNHGTENLRGVFKNARQKAVDYINSMPFFNTLKGLPQKREFYLERSKYLGVVQASSEIGTVLRDEIGNQFLFKKGDKNRGATETLRISIFNYMTTGDASVEQSLYQQLEALDARAAKAAAKAKDMIESLGLQMVESGLMSPTTFYENRRSYLPRIYIKHLLQDPSTERFSYLKRKNENLTPEDQEALGVINELDPAFLVSQAIQRPIRDLQFIEFMNSIAGNNAWTVEDDVLLVKYTDVNGNEQEQSGLYLLNQVDTLREIAKAVEAADPSRAETLRSQANELDEAVKKTFTERGVMEYYQPSERDISGDTQEYGPLFKRVPRGKQYGMLAGRLVRREIYDNVISSMFMLNLGDAAAVKWYQKGKKLTAIWKTIKVPLNPPTIARNTFSNAILIHLSGVPFYRVLPRMIEAAREVISYNNGDFANARHYQEMLARGVKQSSFTDQELVTMQEDMLEFLRSVDAKDLGLFGWLKLNTWQQLAQKASNIYQGIEVIGKTAIAIDVMERQGGSADDAYLRAQEYLFDYGDVPDIVRGARQSPLGIPFLTFQYKVLPILAKTALRNPMRFAPYVALSYALPALFMSAFDIDDDEYEAIKTSMPDYIRGNPGLIPLPARDAEGRLQFLDTSYLYPWGSFTNLINGAYISGKKAVGVADPAEKGVGMKDIATTLGMFGGPGWSLYDLTMNRDSFTERPIVNPNDPLFIADAIERPFYNRGKITDAMFWAANQYLLPGFLNTEYGAVSKINTALKGDVKPNGVAPDTLSQSIFRMIGLNAIALDPLQIRLSLEYIDREKSDIISGINRLRRDQTLSNQEKRRRINSYLEVLERFRLQREAIIKSAATANRVTRRLKLRDERAERQSAKQ